MTESSHHVAFTKCMIFLRGRRPRAQPFRMCIPQMCIFAGHRGGWQFTGGCPIRCSPLNRTRLPAPGKLLRLANSVSPVSQVPAYHSAHLRHQPSITPSQQKSQTLRHTGTWYGKQHHRHKERPRQEPFFPPSTGVATCRTYRLASNNIRPRLWHQHSDLTSVLTAPSKGANTHHYPISSSTAFHFTPGKFHSYLVQYRLSREILLQSWP